MRLFSKENIVGTNTLLPFCKLGKVEDNFAVLLAFPSKCAT